VIAIDALPGVPEVRPGDDLAALLAAAAERIGGLESTDVLVVAHKVVSKAEGRIVRLADVTPGERATALAAEHGKDARQVEVVLSESAEIVRADAGRLICRTRHGFVCANAGVDASNAGHPDAVVLLPEDPDASARALRQVIGDQMGTQPCVVISDSFGRPWRFGIVDVALGVAGFAPLDDQRGRPDADGRVMRSTIVALADEICSAAELASGKTSRRPVVLVRGLELAEVAGSVTTDVVMPPEMDLFR
jgi:coenzyme F420-0:L-glutamate ligase/coenzyme F420-1:gamma-L-glutamate ligase